MTTVNLPIHLPNSLFYRRYLSSPNIKKEMPFINYTGVWIFSIIHPHGSGRNSIRRIVPYPRIDQVGSSLQDRWQGIMKCWSSRVAMATLLLLLRINSAALQRRHFHDRVKIAFFHFFSFWNLLNERILMGARVLIKRRRQRCQWWNMMDFDEIDEIDWKLRR